MVLYPLRRYLALSLFNPKANAIKRISEIKTAIKEVFILTGFLEKTRIKKKEAIFLDQNLKTFLTSFNSH
jgi:hypothetical protein